MPIILSSPDRIVCPLRLTPHVLEQLDDQHKVDVIIMEGVEEAREGLAVMNRIRKAASSIIHC